MATWNDRPHSTDVLMAAERWKQDCLLRDGSLFAGEALWTEDNVTALRAAFLNTPILGSAKFIDKLQQQVSNSTPAIQQLAAEALWLLFLFVSDNQMGPVAKRDRLARIWPMNAGSLPESSLLGDEALSGIGRPGAAFMTKIPDELGYLLSVVAAFKQLSSDQRGGLLSDPWRFATWLDPQPGSNRRAFRHMLLFLCFPAAFERTSSGRHKLKIRESFSPMLPMSERRSEDRSLLGTDQVIRSIRELLEKEHDRTDLDFYLPPLRSQWLESEGGDQIEPGPEPAEGRRFWIEKTIVRGRRDREAGDHALGRALWSPQASKSGGHIYANMRRVREGDVVFHLTDNEAITGVSVAAGGADDSFTGLAGTDWEGPAYRVPLIDFKKLDPPLLREAFLETQPFSTELHELAESGVKGLFYNSQRGLNQGAYLTEATPILLSILSRAYQANTGEAFLT